MSRTADSERSRFGGSTGLRAEASGFFRVARLENRWWLVDPDGHAFLSMGLNHISSDPLRRTHTLERFAERYGDEAGWIRNGVTHDLKDWGFNTIGWTQDIAFRYPPHDPRKRRDKVDPARGWGRDIALFHDRVWDPALYASSDLPYVFMLNFVGNAYYWDGSPWVGDYVPQYPDVFSSGFEDYCDWVARHFCTRLADDPRLIGYFYADVPDWAGEVHSNGWVDDPETPEGRVQLGAVAERYYETTHRAVRRYDRRHLIFGDRFLGDRRIPDPVLDALVPTVDVLSIQYGGDYAAERAKVRHCHARTAKPVLLADAVMPPHAFTPPTQEARGRAYVRYVREALAEDFVVGIHFCGAYIEDPARGWGVKSARDEPYEDIVRAFREVHPQIYALALASAGEER